MSQQARGRPRQGSGAVGSPSVLLMVLLLMPAMLMGLAGCGGSDAEAMPEWVEAVYPEPGATLAVPDGVEVDHRLDEPDTEIRLIIDGVDVTSYASFEGAKVRYEPGFGPVALESGTHTAEVQQVRLPADGIEDTVLDSYSWEFRTG